MIDIAKEKSKKENLYIPFIVYDAVSFSVDDKFGAIFIPYNSISFIDNQKLTLFIKNIKKHLLKGGKFLFDISRNSPDLYNENKKRTVPWSEELFIKELYIKLRRRMEMTTFSDKNITESVYYWEIKYKDGKIETKETKMYFSTYDAEFYINNFEQNGFKLNEIINQEYIKENNIKRVHSFVELFLF